MINLQTKLTKLSECVAATQVSNEHISCLHFFMDIEIMLLLFLSTVPWHLLMDMDSRAYKICHAIMSSGGWLFSYYFLHLSGER